MNAKQKLDIYRNVMQGKYQLNDRYSFDPSAISYSLIIADDAHRIVVTKTVHTNDKRSMGVEYDMRITDQKTGRRSSDRNSHAARIIFNATIHTMGKSK